MTADREDDQKSDLARPFSPYTKCCTFTPRIPNYMVGGILSDSDKSLDEGKKRILEKIKLRDGIIPNGIYPTNQYHNYYLENSEKEFGKSKHLLCPYYIDDQFNCTIWKYRESMCSFWFCKHLAGDTGAEFWKSMIDYFKFIQESLIDFSARRFGLIPVDLYGEKQADYLSDIKHNGDAELQYSNMWGKWENNETQYYISCYEIVMNSTKSEVNQRLEGGKVLEQEVENKLNELLALPEYLIIDKNTIMAVPDDLYQIELSSYIKSIDRTIGWSFKLPRYVLENFDGNTSTDEIIRKLQKKFSTKLDPEIVISLFRHGVLKKANY